MGHNVSRIASVSLQEALSMCITGLGLSRLVGRRICVSVCVHTPCLHVRVTISVRP